MMIVDTHVHVWEMPPRGARRVRRVVSVPLALLLAACATSADPPRAPAGIAACVAETGTLSADATLERAAGSYLLTLVAPAADGAPITVSGSLQLVPNEAALRLFAEGVTTPLYGWVEIELQAVGALEIGDAGSRDPLRPGVLVLEQRPAAAAVPEITLRLGSLANLRTGRGAFDGGYLALHVEHLEPGSFRGRWVSGVHATRVNGHFCATQVALRT
jgi:hypothetical protein